MADANCRGMDPELFFADRGDSLAVRAAKAICRECDVQAECLAYAITNGETHGIWGGKAREERLAIARRAGFTRRVAKELPETTRRVAQCGTQPGYRRHLRDGETPCDDCRQAHRDATNEANARRRAGAA
jgi:WhiB family redox-sensing transcriptional regulator